MRRIILVFSIGLFFVVANAQVKKVAEIYSKFLNLSGTEYVIAIVDHWSKMEKLANSMVFINTSTGESNTVNFPDEILLKTVEHIHLDT